MRMGNHPSPGRGRTSSAVPGPGPHSEGNENPFSALAAWLSPGGAGSSGELSVGGGVDVDDDDEDSGHGAVREEKENVGLEAGFSSSSSREFLGVQSTSRKANGLRVRAAGEGEVANAQPRLRGLGEAAVEARWIGEDRSVAVAESKEGGERADELE